MRRNDPERLTPRLELRPDLAHERVERLEQHLLRPVPGRRQVLARRRRVDAPPRVVRLGKRAADEQAAVLDPLDDRIRIALRRLREEGAVEIRIDVTVGGALRVIRR
jgi:hypothetical protein